MFNILIYINHSININSNVNNPSDPACNPFNILPQYGEILFIGLKSIIKFDFIKSMLFNNYHEFYAFVSSSKVWLLDYKFIENIYENIEIAKFIYYIFK